MTDDALPRPRRALPPAEDAAPPAAPPAARGRRWVEPPDDLDFFAAPPPVPVLPSGAAGATPGRRFSADDLPDDWAPKPPRRSATSPSDLTSPASPPSPARDVAAGQAAPAIPEPATGLGVPLPGAGHEPPEDRPRWLVPAIAVALVVALIAIALLIVRPGSSASVAPRTLLAEPAEFAGLLAGTAWTPTDDAAPDETRGLRCVSPGAELRPATPLAGRTLRRTFTSAAGAPATVVQQLESYPDAAAARQGFAARLAQLGGCVGSPDRVLAGFAVTGLGEEAGAVRVAEQDAAARVHHLLVVRAGSYVTVVDAHADGADVAVDALARALQPSVARLCRAGGSGCAGPLAVTESDQPPAGVPPGFLTTGDLPRVTPGSGFWVGAQIQPLTLAGSGCEGVPLTAVPGATAAQHAFVLKDDPRSSPNFGLDELLYTFGGPAEASAFATALTTNLAACQQSKQESTVTPLGTLPAPAVGRLFTVDQRTSLDRVARSRIMVGVAGDRVVYLAANPTPQFDLSNEAWLDVLNRAVRRATQRT